MPIIVGNYIGQVKKDFLIVTSDYAVTLDQKEPYQYQTQYDGTRHLPKVEIQKNTSTGASITLKEGEDYYVEYGRNIDAGYGSVKVISRKKAFEDLTYSFMIEPASIEKADVLEIPDQDYTKSAVRPEIYASYKTTSGTALFLVEGIDYRLSYRNNTDIGTGTVMVSAMGNYAGSRELSFRIVASDLQIRLASSQEIRYDGRAKTPKFVITRRGTELSEGKDYQVTYTDNIDAGIAKAEIHFLTVPEEDAVYPFVIQKANIAEAAKADPIADQLYTGGALTPEPIVTYTVEEVGDTLLYALKNGVDYTVTYSDNIEAGTAKVLIMGLSSSNFYGVLEKTFRIVDERPFVTIQGKVVSEYVTTYNTARQLPKVEIYPGKDLTQEPLVNGLDYEVFYGENIDAGEGTIKIRYLKAIYSYGEETYNFTIQPADLAKAKEIIIPDQYYTGKEITPDFNVEYAISTNSSIILTEGKDYSVKFMNNIRQGSADVIVTGQKNYIGTKETAFNITSGNDVTYVDPQTKVPTVSVYVEKPGHFTYTGKEIRPGITVSPGNNDAQQLVENIDYTIEYENNIEAGTATVVIKGMGLYVGVNRNTTFEIEPKDISETVMEDIAPQTYHGSRIEPYVSLIDMERKVQLQRNIDYDIIYQNNVNKGTATVTVVGRGNYTGSMEKTFEIVSSDISMDTESISISSVKDQIYTGTEIHPEITVYDHGELLAEGTDYTVSYVNCTNAGEATVIITGMKNLEGKKQIHFQILPKSISDHTVANKRIPTKKYTSEAFKPAVNIYDTARNSRRLTAGKDYTCVYYDNVVAGTAKVTVFGTGNYTGSRSISFKINRVKLSEAMVKGVKLKKNQQ